MNNQKHTVMGKTDILSIVAYPLQYSQLLMQIGHEPLQLDPLQWLIGYPDPDAQNVFQYVGHIYQVDGLIGCYRGIIPWVSTTLLYKLTLNKMKKSFPQIPNEGMHEDDLHHESSDWFESVLCRGVVSRTVAVIVSQPLHVITMRTVAQFVGRETKYLGIFSTMRTILREEGLLGLFSGLFPRLFSEIFIYTVVTTGIYLTYKYVVRDQKICSYVKPVLKYFARDAIYPLTVIGNCMTVTNCGLRAGSPPYMPHYDHMFACWSHLQSTTQLYRGSCLLW